MSIPVLASGELSPGSYELKELAQTLATAFFDLAFVVPEPGAGVLILAAAAARKRSLAHGGARP
jgi:hypothetical protein